MRIREIRIKNFRSLVDVRISTRSYNKVFVDLIHALKTKGDFSSTAVREGLLAGASEASRWPDDEEFEKSWLSLNFYKSLKPAKLRIILEAIEPELRDKKTELLPLPKHLTVEHLMPREWEKHWPLPQDREEKDAADNRESLINSIGNLTLLTKELNPSVSNGPWHKKREAILKYSLLNLNRTLPESWDEVAIRKRTEALLVVAKRVWKRQSAAAAVSSAN